MNIAVVDDTKVRRMQLVESLQKMRHNVTPVSTSQDFMAMVEERLPDRLLIDVDTWKKGKAVYQYFQIGRKLEKTPILFYNSFEGFTLEGFRAPHEKDRVLPEPSKVEDVISALEQTL